MLEHVDFEVVDGIARYDGRTLVEWLPRIVDDIVRTIDPIEIILFGSLARGEESEHSDVDLIVVRPDVTRATRVPLALRIRAAITAPVPLDLVVLSPAELAERAAVPGTLRRAVQEGRRLHVRSL